MKYRGGISIIIPIYNEERLLEKELLNLLVKLNKSLLYEIILIENGSRDKTYTIARSLAKKFRTIRVIKEHTPSYGSAVKKGLESAKYETIVQFDLDLIDLHFFHKAVNLLKKADIVVGSKTLAPSSDKRSFMRMAVTRFINLILRTYLGYKGTDTHGIKAYNKKRILPLLKEVINTNLFFDTEVLLLAQKYGLTIKELSISATKLRPTRFTMHIVVFQTIFEFISLLLRRSYYLPTYHPTITIDDYGLNRKVCKTVDAIIKNTRIDTISVLPHSTKTIPRYKGSIACHINLIEGKPLSDTSTIRSLVDKNGNFYPFIILYIRLLLNQVSFIELALEIENQIKSAAKFNHLSELNSHQHTHTLYPIDRITDVISKKYTILKIRRYGDITHFSLRGYLFKIVFKSFILLEHLCYGKKLSQSPIWKNNKVPISFMSWETTFKTPVKRLELVCHPGTDYDRNILYTSILK